MSSGIKNSWMVIVNPKAGVGKGLTDWPQISNQLNRSGVVFSCVFTEKKHHAVELTVKAINDGYRKIVAIGGDGTINEIVNGIFIQQQVPTSDILLAVVAVGTGNDWIRMFGIPKTYPEAVKAIVLANTVLQDVGLITYQETLVTHKRYMANVAGLGFDAMVNRKFNRLKEEGRKGKWLYIMSTLKALFAYKSKHFKVTIDGEMVLDADVFSATVGIGKYNGGGMMQMPNAVFDDGLFDVTLIRKKTKASVIYNFRKLYNGRIYKLANITAWQGKQVRIESIPESPIEIDGEAMGYSPFTFELIPQCIRVVVGEKFYSSLTQNND